MDTLKPPNFTAIERLSSLSILRGVYALDAWLHHSVYVTGFEKSHHTKTSNLLNFIAQDDSYTQDLSQCLYCPIYTGLLSGGHFANPVMSWFKEWHLWGAPIGDP